MKKREGSIHLPDTHLGIREENVNEESLMKVYMTVILHLRLRGFRVIKDPQVKKRHRIISSYYHYGRKSDLEVSIGLCGRTIKIEFYQNLVFENSNGGKYDFGKYRKMPYLLQKQFLLESAKLLEMLVATYGYELDESFPPSGRMVERVIDGVGGINPVTEPLRRFNDGWGAGRFRRDESGWPVVGEYTKTKHNVDREGVPLRNGMTRYWRDRNGYLRRGIIHPNMNEMWQLIYGPGRHDTTWVSCGELFILQPDDCRGRKIPPEKRDVRVNKELAAAVKEMNFEKAVILRDILAVTPARKAA